MDIRILRDRRAALVAEGDSLFAAVEAAGGVMTDEQRAADDRITADIAQVDADIARAEAHIERRRQTAATSVPAAPRSAIIAPRGAFRTLGEQMAAIARAGQPGVAASGIDPRLVWAGPTGLGETIDADGGFLVDQQFVPDLLENVFKTGEVLSRVRDQKIGEGFDGIKMNGVDETNRTNGYRSGGVRAYWTGEAQLMTASQPKFRQIKMDLEGLTALCYATDQLLRDSTALESWLIKAFEDEMQFKAEDAIFNGTGVGMPLGILNSPAVVTVSKESSQAANTVVAENILKMWARMPARLRLNAVWFINQDVEPQLWQLNVKIKNVAGTENVGGVTVPMEVAYKPPGSVAGSPYGLLMGRPVVPVEYSPSLTNVGDIMLADLSQYMFIQKAAGPEFASSIHVRFLYNETAFRFVWRANGQPLHAAPITPYKGSNTLSPFTVLQSR